MNNHHVVTVNREKFDIFNFSVRVNDFMSEFDKLSPIRFNTLSAALQFAIIAAETSKVDSIFVDI